MKKIEVNSSGFKDEFIRLNGKTSLKFTDSDLIRASISIGYSDRLSVFKGGWERLYEMKYHEARIKAYTCNHNGNFGLSERFWGLDPSEKNPIIYSLGMIVTKLIAERFLDIPWLQHIDNMLSKGLVTITAGSRKRGDLAGLDALKRWHVFESKGRSHKPSNKELEKGKNQAGRIQAITTQIPITKCICLSHFQKKQTIVYFNDPNNGGDLPSTTWEIDIKNYLLFYYKRILNQLKYENSYTENISINVSEFEFRIFRVEDISFEIGILSPIDNNVKNYSINFMDNLKEFQTILKENYRENLEGSMSIGLDGIIVRPTMTE